MLISVVTEPIFRIPRNADFSSNWANLANTLEMLISEAVQKAGTDPSQEAHSCAPLTTRMPDPLTHLLPPALSFLVVRNESPPEWWDTMEPAVSTHYISNSPLEIESNYLPWLHTFCTRTQHTTKAVAVGTVINVNHMHSCAIREWFHLQ